MKKYFSVVLCVAVIAANFPVRVSAVSLGISASSAIVMVADTGEVLYQHNAHVRRSMASTTKIMTALLALENADLKKEVTVSESEVAVEGTSMGLLPDDKVTFEGLVYGMLLQSGNDAANVTAIKLGGSIENFVKLMNQRAEEIGMANTNFVTPSGLDADEHYSTAYDMALLACEAIKNPEFRNIASQKQAVVYYGNPPYRRTLTNHNKMLSYYEGCIGVKTGYTKKSGRCLVSAAERDSVTIVAVTLNAPDDWNDHKILLDYGFEKTENRTLSDEVSYNISVVGGNKKSVKLAVQESAFVNVSEGMGGITTEYLIDNFLYAPVKKGDTAGKVVYYLNSKKVAESILVADETVTAVSAPEKISIWQRFLNFLKSFFEN